MYDREIEAQVRRMDPFDLDELLRGEDDSTNRSG
jgi:hypothetical protein